jgi:hypothetical protein
MRDSMLRVLRVPPEPQAPFGDPASVRTFRASRRFYYLRLLRWSLTQAAALAGLVFWITVIAVSEQESRRMRAQGPNAGSLSQLPPGRNRVTLAPLRGVPPSVFMWLWVAKALGLLIYVGQLAITYVALRLDYEMRWYMVTDRSLRIRSGVWNVQEVTMSFANLQQVMVSQGPIERLLGLANVRVESAGGGKASSSDDSKSDTMHCGVFHGVEDAEEIRDLVLERLRRFRESGLGDPDELTHPTSPPPTPSGGAVSTEALQAARELLAEARELKTRVFQQVTKPR